MEKQRAHFRRSQAQERSHVYVSERETDNYLTMEKQTAQLRRRQSQERPPLTSVSEEHSSRDSNHTFSEEQSEYSYESNSTFSEEQSDYSYESNSTFSEEQSEYSYESNSTFSEEQSEYSYESNSTFSEEQSEYSYESNSTLSEEQSEYESTRKITEEQLDRPYSPLPPLTIEIIPKINKHDEPEEYYTRLEEKMIKLYSRRSEYHKDVNNRESVELEENDVPDIPESIEEGESHNVEVAMSPRVFISARRSLDTPPPVIAAVPDNTDYHIELAEDVESQNIDVMRSPRECVSAGSIQNEPDDDSHQSIIEVREREEARIESASTEESIQNIVDCAETIDSDVNLRSPTMGQRNTKENVARERLRKRRRSPSSSSRNKRKRY